MLLSDKRLPVSLLVFSFEFNGTFDLSKQCIVAADTYVVARMKFSTSLSNQNAAGAYELAVASLDA